MVSQAEPVSVDRPMPSTSAPLWSSRHLAVVGVLNFFGGVLIAVGWYKGSGQKTTGEMLAWLNVGIAGLILLGAANALHLFRGRMVVKSCRRVLVREVPRFSTAVLPEKSREGDYGVRERVLVAAPAAGHFHVLGCPLARGKDTNPGTFAGFERAGLSACEVCEP